MAPRRRFGRVNPAVYSMNILPPALTPPSCGIPTVADPPIHFIHSSWTERRDRVVNIHAYYSGRPWF
jgi:hypothetical protein